MENKKPFIITSRAPPFFFSFSIAFQSLCQVVFVAHQQPLLFHISCALASKDLLTCLVLLEHLFPYSFSSFGFDLVSIFATLGPAMFDRTAGDGIMTCRYMR